jgi:shikimate kinase
VVRQVSGRQGCVVATGGGTLLDPRNVRRLSEHGVLLLLTARIPTLVERLRRPGAGVRPLLGEEAGMGRLLSLLEARRSSYGAVRARVATDGLTVAEVAARAWERYLGLGGQPPRGG